MSLEKIDKKHWFPEKIFEHEVVERFERDMQERKEAQLRAAGRSILSYIERTEDLAEIHAPAADSDSA